MGVRVKSLKLTEAQFQRQVIQLAQFHAWMVVHFRAGLNRRGQWQTAVEGDAAGYPDLTLVHEGLRCVVFAELKVGRGRLTEAQELWRRTLLNAGQHYYVWRPTMWLEIERTLGFGPKGVKTC